MDTEGVLFYDVLYADDNFVIVGKKQGIAVQPDRHGETSLIEFVRMQFGPSCELCHRLDRNTGGIVIIARNEPALEAVTSGIKENQIKKYYHTVLCGRLPQNIAAAARGRGGRKERAFHEIQAWHFKDARKGMVYIYDYPKKFAKKIITEYRVLSYDRENDTTLAEVRLVTGRTHQIRAQFAHLGFPVAGDGKYGRNAMNKKLPYRYQALWAWKIDFNGVLRTFGVPDVFTYEPDFR